MEILKCRWYFRREKSAFAIGFLARATYQALGAMEFAKSYHTGTRKDNVTPEFDHQISIAHFVRALPDLMYPEDSLTVTMLHDVREDFDVTDRHIRTEYGDRVADAVECVTKVFKGVKKDAVTVFRDIANDPIASIVKGGDRQHNFSSMANVFKRAKQIEYIAEGKEYFIPMIKTARRLFPRQEAAYELIKQSLNSQMTMISAIHEASEG